MNYVDAGFMLGDRLRHAESREQALGREAKETKTMITEVREVCTVSTHQALHILKEYPGAYLVGGSPSQYLVTLFKETSTRPESQQTSREGIDRQVARLNGAKKVTRSGKTG